MNAYWIMGDSEHALVRRTEPPKERTWEQSAELMPEIGHEAAFVRNYPGWPSWLGYVCTPNDDRKIKFAIADAITSFDAELGASVLVSESAAHKLQPYLQGQAEFHPAKINGVPQPYHLLWTRNVIDALDYERSRLAPVEYLARDGVVPLRLVQAEFQANKIRDQMVFRLVPGRLTRTSLKDFATEEFLRLVKSLKISGFHFYRNHAERPLVPVKLGAKRPGA